MTVDLGPSGAYLKASYVPDVGEVVELRELQPGRRGADLRIRALVVWAASVASLARPETGFAVEFQEAWVAGNTLPLEELVATLAPGQPAPLREEERDGRRVAVHDFAAGRAASAARAALPDEPVVTDLAAELDRLEGEGAAERPARRRGLVSRVRVGTSRRGTDHVRADDVYAGEAGTEAASRAVPGDATTPAGEEPAPRGHSRRVTGIFTALFARADSSGELLANLPGEEGPGTGAPGSPAVGSTEGDDDDSDPGFGPRDQWGHGIVTVSWKDGATDARVESMTESIVTLATRGTAPLYYERVVIAPRSHVRSTAELLVYGTVTRLKEADVSGKRLFSVRVTQVDERGNQGLLREYIRAVSGRT